MDGKSKDLMREYIEQIRGLFPEAVTEVADKEGNSVISHKVDMEKLAILLGEAAIPADEIEYRQKFGEKFSFEWAGKRRAIAEAQKRSTGTLRPCPAESVDWDDTENLYIEGDNLEVLKLLQDSYIGKVKMIYIDPPYNTGKDFVYKDDYRDNLSNYIEMTNTTNAVNSEASGRYHTNWLNMMYPRLKLARNLLTDDGVIFISLDENEISNLKNICNEIFGEDNFVTSIVWQKRYTRSNNTVDFTNTTENILVYSKSNSFIVNLLPRSKEADDRYTNPDNDIRGPWKGASFLNPATPSQRPNLCYPITNPYTNETTFPTTNAWRRSKEQFEHLLAGDFLYWGSDKRAKVPSIKMFLSEARGLTPINLWLQDYAGNTDEGSSVLQELGLNKFFDFPKPTKLIQRVLEHASNENCIILDFFSGSATTAHAVMQLNAEDGGSRKYICVQLPEQTPEDSEARKAGFNTIPEIAKERIRRAGKKILEEQKAKNDGLFAEEAQKLDVGFKVFKLDRSNVKEWDVEFDGLTEKQAAEALAMEFSKTMDILKDGRTELDLLYEVMLKLGLQLSTNVETEEVDDKTVFVVGHGVMIASFAKGLTSAQIGKMLDLKADFIQAGEFKVVLSDESFASDNDKTNAMQLFKQRGITNYEII